MAESNELYEEIVADLDEVFAELGGRFTIERAGQYNEDTQEYDPPTRRETLGILANEQTAAELSGGGFQFIGKSNLIFPHTLAPQRDECVLLDGHSWPLTKIEQVKPAEVLIMYILDVTR